MPVPDLCSVRFYCSSCVLYCSSRVFGGARFGEGESKVMVGRGGGGYLKGGGEALEGSFES